MEWTPPPNWPAKPHPGWIPPRGWAPDPTWGPAPMGWDFWPRPRSRAWLGPVVVAAGAAAYVAGYVWTGQSTVRNPAAGQAGSLLTLLGLVGVLAGIAILGVAMQRGDLRTHRGRAARINRAVWLVRSRQPESRPAGSLSAPDQLDRPRS